MSIDISQPVMIAHAAQFDLASEAGLPYRIFVQPPEGDAPPSGYPSYYFTDANASFGLVAALAQALRHEIGPLLLVGIGYGAEQRGELLARRIYDLTPPTPRERAAWFWEIDGARAPAQFGGQHALWQFIEQQLKPLLARRFAIDQRRQALFGHSLGGLFALHTLLRQPASFQTYIAASASLWLNPEQLTADMSEYQPPPSLEPPRVLLTIGERERHDYTAKRLRAQAAGAQPPDSDGLRAALAERLERLGMPVSIAEFAGENHGSVIPLAHMRALRFAFGQHHLPRH